MPGNYLWVLRLCRYGSDGVRHQITARVISCQGEARWVMPGLLLEYQPASWPGAFFVIEPALRNPEGVEDEEQSELPL